MFYNVYQQVDLLGFQAKLLLLHFIIAMELHNQAYINIKILHRAKLMIIINQACP